MKTFFNKLLFKFNFKKHNGVLRGELGDEYSGVFNTFTYKQSNHGFNIGKLDVLTMVVLDLMRGIVSLSVNTENDTIVEEDGLRLIIFTIALANNVNERKLVNERAAVTYIVFLAELYSAIVSRMTLDSATYLQVNDALNLVLDLETITIVDQALALPDDLKNLSAIEIKETALRMLSKCKVNIKF